MLLSPWNVVPSPIHAVAPLWLGDGFGSVGGLDGLVVSIVMKIPT